MIRSTVLVVGGEAVDAGVGPAVCELARRTRTGVLNTWRAKGLFRFDDPAHLGTIGLQRDDLVLAGVAGEQRSFERVVVCGVADGELPDQLTGGLPADAEVVSPGDVAALHLDVRDDWLPRPPLYDALASVCGPRYLVDDVPLSPVRAAGERRGPSGSHRSTTTQRAPAPPRPTAHPGAASTSSRSATGAPGPRTTTQPADALATTLVVNCGSGRAGSRTVCGVRVGKVRPSQNPGAPASAVTTAPAGSHAARSPAARTGDSGTSSTR